MPILKDSDYVCEKDKAIDVKEFLDARFIEKTVKIEKGSKSAIIIHRMMRKTLGIARAEDYKCNCDICLKQKQLKGGKPMKQD